MGHSSAEVEREIGLLRRETGLLVEELEHRAREATDVRAQVGRHRGAAVAVLVAIAGGVAAVVAYGIRQRRESRPFIRKRALWQRKSEHTSEGRSAGVAKSVLWTMLTAGMVALGVLLARRLSARLWEATLHERPPERVA